MSAVRTRVFVEGRVQGVWFRESTRQMAEQTGVAGWVRNLADGRVEAVFEGPAEQVAQAVEWMRHGPERAMVTATETAEERVVGLTGFAINPTYGDG